MKLFADLPGKKASENLVGTILDDLIVTSARPDIVLVENTGIKLLELTIPHNSQESMYKAKEIKNKKENHQKVLSDFDAKNLPATIPTELYTIEMDLLAIGYPVPEILALLKLFLSLKKSQQLLFLTQQESGERFTNNF